MKSQKVFSRTIFLLFFLSFSFISLCPLFAEEQEETNLVSWQADFLMKDGQRYLAIVFENKPEWHTYWKNPGDAGTPFQFQFFLNNQKMDLEEQEWTAPKTFIAPGDLVAYGYEGRYGFFFHITEKQHQQLLNQTLTIKPQWLVCKHICLPGSDERKAQYKQDVLSLSDSSVNALTILPNELDQFWETIPRSLPSDKASLLRQDKALLVELRASDDRKSLSLYYRISPISPADLLEKRSVLTPFPEKLVSFHREILKYDPILKELYGKITMDWDGEYAEGGAVEIPKNLQWKKPFELSFLWQDRSSPSASKITLSFSQMEKQETPLLSQFTKAPPLSPTSVISQSKEPAQEKPQGFFLPSSTPL
jgi:DsbC/DsbD-like thiol-disulfide interchange protein